MKRFLQYFLFAAAVFAGVTCFHSRAEAAPLCSMNQTSLADLIANYDPPLATASTTIPVAANTLSFKCTGLPTNGMGQHVYVLVSGSSGSYATPSLNYSNGANSFQLTYNLCVPGAATCNATAGLWNMTANANVSAYEVSANNSPAVNNIPAFQIYVGRQDAFVGTTAQYTGSLFFQFRCGEGGNQVDCTSTTPIT